MNHTQRKYATERVSAIKTQKQRALQDRYYAAAKPELSARQRFELIVDGVVPLKGLPDGIPYNASPRNIWDFSGYEGHSASQKAAFEEAQRAIEKEARTVTDKLMLGDAEGALEALNAFEALEV